MDSFWKRHQYGKFDHFSIVFFISTYRPTEMSIKKKNLKSDQHPSLYDMYWYAVQTHTYTAHIYGDLSLISGGI